LLQKNASWNALYVKRGLLNFNINIVYSTVLQALEILGLKVVIVCCTGQSGAPIRTRALRLQPHGWSGPRNENG